ncbi:lysosomal acid glucosylceramidase-like [Periplaneta americana]|uniref:lysosomal acid glucosylceramidase-like n=1 Tax=Periplaneta americana TaxID=6978 RepID=UPI0037E754B7
MTPTVPEATSPQGRMWKMWNLLIVLVTFILCACTEFPCVPRRYDQDSVVCVCNSTYCDSPKKLPEDLLQGYYAQYMSSRKGKRLHLSAKPVGYKNQSVQFSHSSLMFHVNTSQRYQHIIGFGGSMTDSSGINVASLSQGAQENLLRQYFGDEGIGYTLIRVPMGGTDCSTHFYTYDDIANDTNLVHFNLTNEDLKFKLINIGCYETNPNLESLIPYIKRCVEISSRTIKLIAAPWSAPKWMKESTTFMKEPTRLKKKYYQIWANYFIKFLDAYKRYGIRFWSLSPQNEPFFGNLIFFEDILMGWTPTEIKSFVVQNLGPTLYASGYGDIQLIIHDDQRAFFPLWFHALADEKLMDYVSGFAFHWYLDRYFISPPKYLDYIHRKYEKKFLLYTEASIVPFPFQPAVRLGTWRNAEKYAESILEVFEYISNTVNYGMGAINSNIFIVHCSNNNLLEIQKSLWKQNYFNLNVWLLTLISCQDVNHWANGWMDWNLALDMKGGPNYINNALDSPIIVNSTADEFYKQPMFYAMAHVTTFVPPGSQRIAISDSNRKTIKRAAFLTDEGNIVIVILNRDYQKVHCVITDEYHRYIRILIPAHSIHTIVYKNLK